MAEDSIHGRKIARPHGSVRVGVVKTVAARSQEEIIGRINSVIEFQERHPIGAACHRVRGKA
jgi:hypothetical protein